jgi:putative flippase GtrA
MDKPYVKNIRHQFVRYAIAFSLLPQYIVVGAITVLTNMITFSLVFNFSKDIYVSTLLGNLVSALANFKGLSKIFVSESRDIVPTLVKYVISLFLYYLVSVWTTLFFIDLGLIEVVARALAICLLVAPGYLANRYLVFKRVKD